MTSRYDTKIAALLALICAFAAEGAHAQVAAGNRGASKKAPAVIEWTAYGHDAGGSKFSPANRITRDNVKNLVPVWTYRTGDFSRGDATARDETTPLYVDGTLFASTPFGGVRALNAETGREIWSFDSELDLSGDYGDFTNRGVSTWIDRALPRNAPCRRRIYVAPVDARLIALDARTGNPCTDFGQWGQIDLSRGVVNEPEYKGEFSVTSPPAIIGDLVIVGSTVADGHRAHSPAGVVRAFDARTGALRWSWDPVPRDSTQVGYNTWRGTSAHLTGAANAWSIISVDSARDLVFVPTGSASPDFFGGERLGQNLFANSVVALRASTGKMVWHFQVVHHDLWDYDVPAEPVLFTMHRGGKEIPALIQTTKMGHVFILNRETGAPLFPVEERPVPPSDVPGEEAWPTQPFPTLPAPLGPTKFSPSEIFALNDSSRRWCEAQLAGARSEGIFTPPSVRGTVIFPGNIGGSNWSGVALDPVRRLAIIPSNRIITVVDLIPRAQLHERAMGGTRFDEFGAQLGTAFGMRRRHLVAPDGVPCNPPPWGVLTAIDLESGQRRWERPLGGVPRLSANAGSDKWGSPNLGGAMVTAGSIVFAGGAVDQRLHAYDVETGKELWSAELPAGVHGSPMTYVTPAGEQLVVVAAGGHKELRDKVGDYIVAFALGRSGSSPLASTPITSGDYEGQIVLDRTRLPIQIHLAVSGTTVAVTFETSSLHIEGRGTGEVAGDTFTSAITWTFPAQHCSGAMQMRGSSANGGAAVIGELEYMDGCSDKRMKSGTFAVWKGKRGVTRVQR
ncbi:MAG: pyrroloquinoline quinone-dependent dehydrogenase [Gemmatimonadaceae bacterium]